VAERRTRVEVGGKSIDLVEVTGQNLDSMVGALGYQDGGYLTAPTLSSEDAVTEGSFWEFDWIDATSSQMTLKNTKTQNYLSFTGNMLTLTDALDATCFWEFSWKARAGGFGYVLKNDAHGGYLTADVAVLPDLEAASFMAAFKIEGELPEGSEKRVQVEAGGKQVSLVEVTGHIQSSLVGMLSFQDGPYLTIDTSGDPDAEEVPSNLGFWVFDVVSYISSTGSLEIRLKNANTETDAYLCAGGATELTVSDTAGELCLWAFVWMDATMDQSGYALSNIGAGSYVTTEGTLTADLSAAAFVTAWRVECQWSSQHACEGDTLKELDLGRDECFAECDKSAECKCVTYGADANSPCRLETGMQHTDRDVPEWSAVTLEECI